MSDQQAGITTERPGGLPAADERAWHAEPAEQAAEAFGVDWQHGLDEQEAERRLAEVGPNELRTDPPPSALKVLAHQFTSPLIFILVIAAIVTTAIGELIDTGVIVAVLVLNASLGFYYERKAEKSVQALMELAAPTARVLRDGREVEVAATALVPGDVVLLDSGTKIPADLRLVRTSALRVDESLLTGESEPVSKDVESCDERAPVADRTSMAHMGAVVARGRGRGVVVATATDTQLGAIAESIRGEQQPRTPLQVRMDRFAWVIAAVVLGAAVATFVVGVAAGEDAVEMFMTGVAIAVAVVPEGLPIAFTVALALGVRRMAARNAIIRSLPAVETLGSTTVIGSDKTGTLTLNRMTARQVWAAGRTVDLPDAAAPPDLDTAQAGHDAHPDGDHPDAAGDAHPDTTDADAPGDGQVGDDGPAGRALLAGVLASEAAWQPGDDGVAAAVGEPTEAALLHAAAAAGLDPGRVRDERDELLALPFESERRLAATLTDGPEGPTAWVKGAPERVLELCELLDGDDEPAGLDDDDRERIRAAAVTMAERGLRVLACAWARWDGEAPHADPERIGTPPQLVLAGLVGMKDPPREEVPEAVAACRAAGIRVLMLTGDHLDTARAIAAEIGMADVDDAALAGPDLEEMSDEQLREVVVDTPVYARVTPEHKLRIVHALQARDHTCAVTGDGVNDGPALKAADIGVAMGRSGTDVAREASDMVLTDDHFASIRNAVEEGRVVFDNVRKVTFFLLSTGVAAIVVILTALAAGDRMSLPLLPAQLLWLNVVTNGLQDVALAFEPAERDVLRRRPRRRGEAIVTGVLWERTVLTGVVMALGAVGAFVAVYDPAASQATLTPARSLALTTLVVGMAVHVHACRSPVEPIWRRNPLGNRLLLAATVGALAIHFAALWWGPTQLVLRVEPLPAGSWPWLVGTALAVAAANEGHKRLRRHKAHVIVDDGDDPADANATMGGDGTGQAASGEVRR